MTSVFGCVVDVLVNFRKSSCGDVGGRLLGRHDAGDCIIAWEPISDHKYVSYRMNVRQKVGRLSGITTLDSLPINLFSVGPWLLILV